jgi:hypothetical protein
MIYHLKKSIRLDIFCFIDFIARDRIPAGSFSAISGNLIIHLWQEIILFTNDIYPLLHFRFTRVATVL